MQAFVTQLEDHDWTRGLPKTHQELTLLVRQLALCCAQLEVAGQSAVPDSVKNLIKDMAVSNSKYRYLWVIELFHFVM